ncbi:MAG: NADH-quinone oxidoreductase subunit L [Elusimicrobiota bacterium]|nr:NADH-quinone oxidoreductase subunit L [Endomicrobiia bacterium]MDW8164920.1 NADH-quinone oxidoreductase subunit L [Elusimicrobiota bacterium]
MNNILILSSLILLFISVFLIGSLKNKKLYKFLSLFFISLSLICLVVLSLRFFLNIEKNFLLNFKGINIFIIDFYSLLIILTSVFISLLITLYSFEYISEDENQRYYYFYNTLFIASMIGLVFSCNLILMYIFWELTSLCSWKLIKFYKKDDHITKANKAFLVTSLGSVLMLCGIVINYIEFGSFDFTYLKDRKISDLAGVFLIIGMIAKSAQLPFQSWLPDAGVAPTPVTALLHAAVLVKIGTYAFGRIFNFTFQISNNLQSLIIYLSFFTIFISSFMALAEFDIKRILAYSTISQLGYIFLGFAVNVKESIIGAIFYIISHAFAKAGLFLSAGIIEHELKEKNILKLGGLSKNMPIVSACFFLCGLSIIGFPVFSGFWSKFFILKGMLQANKITLAFLLIIGALLSLVYFMRVYNSVFLGTKKYDIKQHYSWMVFVVALLTFFSVILGVYPDIILKLIKI